MKELIGGGAAALFGGFALEKIPLDSVQNGIVLLAATGLLFGGLLLMRNGYTIVARK